MSMSVNTHLTNLASSLVLTTNEKASIATSITTLNNRAGDYFGKSVTAKYQFGSSVRDTILPRKADGDSDIDYMMVFDTSDGVRKPDSYLERIRKFAEKKYSTSDVARSHPTIVLELNHIKFELVPAVYNHGLQIPSPAKSWTDWLDTNPSAADRTILEKNKNENFQIKPLVRLVKYWNAKQGKPFTSYMLEKYITERYYFSCTNIRDYFYKFWDDIYTSNVYSQSLNGKIIAAKNHVSKAKEYERDGFSILAEDEIKKIVPVL